MKTSRACSSRAPIQPRLCKYLIQTSWNSRRKKAATSACATRMGLGTADATLNALSSIHLETTSTFPVFPQATCLKREPALTLKLKKCAIQSLGVTSPLLILGRKMCSLPTWTEAQRQNPENDGLALFEMPNLTGPTLKQDDLCTLTKAKQKKVVCSILRTVTLAGIHVFLLANFLPKTRRRSGERR